MALCDRCQSAEAQPQQCPGDRAWHRHGGVHVRGGGLAWVCDNCIRGVREEWRPKPLGRRLAESEARP